MKNPGRWAHGVLDYRHPPMMKPQANPYSPKTGERCSCKPGVQRDNCPRCEGTGWVIDFKKIHEKRKENPRMRRVLGLPGTHYYVKRAVRRKRRRSNPFRYGNSGAFRNPGGGGIGTGTLLLIGGAALLLFTPLGSKLSQAIGGAVTGVPGYTPLSNGLYRGPDGALYARNPQTGQMVKAPTGTTPTSATDLLTRAGVQMLPAATTGVANWIRDLFSGTSKTTPTSASQQPAGGSPLLSAAGAALPALPQIGSALFTGGTAPDAELPPLPSSVSMDEWFAGTDWGGFDAAAVDQTLPDLPSMWEEPDLAGIDWAMADAGALDSVPVADSWSFDWGVSGLDQIAFDVPDTSGFDFGFMGLGRRRSYGRAAPRYN